MFESARVKLTAWYLLIIMVVSGLFSLVIYRGTAFEMERGFRQAELRLRAEELGIKLPPRFGHRPFFSEDLEAVRHRVLLFLFYTNGVILVLSAGAAYFLAGKTLRPIERALEDQRRFVADASHELRTPLTALKTSIEVALRDRRMSLKEVKRVLSSNLEEVDSLESLTTNLLSLAQYQKANSHFIFEEVNIKEIIEKVRRKLSPLVKKKRIKLEIKAGEVSLRANKDSLEKALVILVDNAIKYTPSGGKIALKASRTKRCLVLEVKDTGVGIAKKDLPCVFERFYRADQSRSRKKVAGFGLGLSLAREIIKMHGGSIEVKSVLGKGSTFMVKLPIRHS